MDLAVVHPKFRNQKLEIRIAGIFSNRSVLLNGVPVKRAKGAYVVRDDNGSDVAVRLKSNFVDPIPLVVIGTEKVRLVPPLAWYEYTWVGLPILLLFVGGALGGGIGGLATYGSGRIFRSSRSAWAKYALTGAISVCALLLFAVAATALQVIIGRATR